MFFSNYAIIPYSTGKACIMYILILGPHFPYIKGLIWVQNQKHAYVQIRGVGVSCLYYPYQLMQCVWSRLEQKLWIVMLNNWQVLYYIILLFPDTRYNGEWGVVHNSGKFTFTIRGPAIGTLLLRILLGESRTASYEFNSIDIQEISLQLCGGTMGERARLQQLPFCF
jgi:hypothetical protein